MCLVNSTEEEKPFQKVTGWLWKKTSKVKSGSFDATWFQSSSPPPWLSVCINNRTVQLHDLLWSCCSQCSRPLSCSLSLKDAYWSECYLQQADTIQCLLDLDWSTVGCADQYCVIPDLTFPSGVQAPSVRFKWFAVVRRCDLCVPPRCCWSLINIRTNERERPSVLSW